MEKEQPKLTAKEATSSTNAIPIAIPVNGETPVGAVSAAPTTRNLLGKLSDIVAELDHVEKAGRNDFHKYSYVKAADVAWLVRKALSKRNIYMVADVIGVRNYEIPAREGSSQAVDVHMEFSFHDGDNPETTPIVLHSYGTGTDKGDKAIYKAMTGALKYGLRHAFIIPDESDPEADSETDKAREAAKAVGEAKVAELKKGRQKAPEVATNGTPSLFYALQPSGQYAITGDRDLLKKMWPQLKGYWQDHAQCFMLSDEQLEVVKFQCETAKIDFHVLKGPTT